jgi:hypothetical protein
MSVFYSILHTLCVWSVGNYYIQHLLVSYSGERERWEGEGGGDTLLGDII